MVTLKKGEPTPKGNGKRRGFFVYVDLFTAPGIKSKLEALVLCYWINTKRYSPYWVLRNRSMAEYLNISEEMLNDILIHLSKIGYLIENEDGSLELNYQVVNDILGEEIFPGFPVLTKEEKTIELQRRLSESFKNSNTELPCLNFVGNITQEADDLPF